MIDFCGKHCEDESLACAAHLVNDKAHVLSKSSERNQHNSTSHMTRDEVREPRKHAELKHQWLN